MIEQGLYAFLTGIQSVSGLIGARVYPHLMPQHGPNDGPVQPCIVYSKSGDTRLQTFCGTDAVIAASYQIDCYATGFQRCKELAAAVRGALVDYGGNWETVTVKNVRLETEFDLLDPEPGLFRVSQSYRIWYVER